MYSRQKIQPQETYFLQQKIVQYSTTKIIQKKKEPSKESDYSVTNNVQQNI